MALVRRALFVILVGCTSAPPPAKPAAPGAAEPVDEAHALAAYDAKDYPRCAELYATLASGASRKVRGAAYYDAAGCHALAGHADRAFEALDAAVHAGFATDGLEADPDLVSLHGDSRWGTSRPRWT